MATQVDGAIAVDRTRTVTTNTMPDATAIDGSRADLIYKRTASLTWGMTGSGAAQLAIELLLEGGATDQEAAEFSPLFLRDVVARFPEGLPFRISISDIQAYLAVYRHQASLP